MFLSVSCVLGFFLLEEIHPKFRHRVDPTHRLAIVVKSLFYGKKWNQDSEGYSIVEDEDNLEVLELSQVNTGAGYGSTVANNSAFTRQVILQILSTAIQGFLKIATLAMVPVFLATPKQDLTSQASYGKSNTVRGILEVKGGFGMDTTSISNVLLSQAVASIISQILAVPALISRLGPLKSYRCSLIVLVFFYCTLPFVAQTASWIGIATVLLILWLYAFANGLGTTSSAILCVHCHLSLNYTNAAIGSQMQHLQEIT